MKRRTPKIKNREAGIAKILAIGIGISAILSVGLSMLGGKLILAGMVPETWAGWVADGVMLISVLFGSLYIAAKAKKNKLPLAMACAGSYLVLAMVLHAMFLQRAYSNILAACICCAAGALAGGLLGVREKKRRRFG